MIHEPFDKAEIESSIPERFKRIVFRNPDRLAVKIGRNALTYRELDKMSNQVAQAILTRRGAGTEPIAFLLGHEIASIVALFAILKAGKFYVALNPLYPHLRLQRILENIHTKLIITNRHFLSRATELVQNADHILDLDAIDSSFSDDDIHISIASDMFAALFYTSGSTGQPKGVAQNHRNILYNAWNNVQNYAIGGGDRRSLLFLCDFAASATDIFSALLNGATLCPYNVRELGVSPLTT